VHSKRILSILRDQVGKSNGDKQLIAESKT
jgi:hypothetical protein